MEPSHETEAPGAVIAAIARELERRALAFESARDARCVFAHAYARLTRELARALPASGFADPHWVEQLARVFVGYYLRACQAYDAGTLADGAWLTVFRAGDRGHTSVLEDLVLGMTAHIVNDLPQALCDVGLRAADGSSRIADYQRMNGVLAAAVEPIQEAVSRRYDPWLRVLDRLAEHYDEILTGYGLRISRATAWYNAERLLDPRTRADALAAIARAPELTRSAVLDPPLLSLRCAARLARIAARKVRRWPAASRGARSEAALRRRLSSSSPTRPAASRVYH